MIAGLDGFAVLGTDRSRGRPAGRASQGLNVRSADCIRKLSGQCRGGLARTS